MTLNNRLLVLLLLLVPAGLLGYGAWLVVSEIDLPALGGAFAAPAAPVVVVSAQYPGANASTVANTLAAPIEKQVNGVEKMRSMVSRCSDTGSYTLTITFEPKTDLKVAQILVQNRVNIALPLLPDLVNLHGVTVATQTAPLLLLAVTSSDGSQDLRSLSLCATALRETLSKVPGVERITFLGQQIQELRVYIDPEKLAARNLTVADVLRALRDQKLEVVVADNQDKESPVAPLQVRGKIDDPKDLGDLIVKRDAGGRIIRLQEFAQIERGGEAQGWALLGGKQVVVVVLTPTAQADPKKVRAALEQQWEKLREKLPPRITLNREFDFTPQLSREKNAPEYLLIDVAVNTLEKKRLATIVEKAAVQVQKGEEIQSVLALAENPLDANRALPCLLVRLSARKGGRGKREAILAALRAQLKEAIPEARFLIRDLSGGNPFPACRYPLQLALHGPELSKVHSWAERLAQALEKNAKVVDVWVDQASTPQPFQQVVVDRERAATMGVTVQDIYTTLEVVGSSRSLKDDLKELKIRSKSGKMVPVASLVKLHQGTAPAALVRWNGKLVVLITANPAPGASLRDSRKAMESLAQQLRQELQLSDKYQWAWIHED